MRHEKASALLGLARTLASSAEGLTLDEMAAESGVGRRTVERMRDALLDLFPQLEEVSDPPHKRFRIPGGLDGLFQSPTTEELVELTKAADALRANGADVRSIALTTLEKKIRAAMRSAALRRVVPDVEALVRAETIAVQAGPRPFEDEAVIGVIRQAVMAMRALRFRYRGGSRQGQERDVTPFGIMFGRANYLVGAELGSTEPRNYRLDRIDGIEVLALAASPPEDFSLSDYAARSFGVYQDTPVDVVLRVLPGAADDALGWRFHPTQVIEPQVDGSVIVRFSASGLRELAWHLFTWRDQVEILAPAELKQTMIDELKAALARHQGHA
jgi:predicted DNA-binding transcriptional regulator YafY